MGKTVLDLQYKLQHTQAAKQARKASTNNTFSAGILVYLLAPTASALQTASKKIRMDFVGPLVIRSMVDSSHAILGTIEGQQLTGKFHVNRLKPAWVRTTAGPVNSIAKLTGILKAKLGNQHIVTADQLTPIIDETGKTTQDPLYACRVIQDDILQPISQFTKHATSNRNLAASYTLPEEQIKALLQLPIPKTGDYPVTKARIKNGRLQIFVSQNSIQGMWLSQDEHPSLSNMTEKFEKDNYRVSGTVRNFVQRITNQ